MLIYLVTRHNSSPIDWYLELWGHSLPMPVEVIYYEDLPKRRSLPVGTYIFSDLERLDGPLLTVAGQVWQQLAHHDVPMGLLNHPYRSMRRYELLRTLREQGSNAFDIYRLTEHRRPQRFPVFIRGENDHRGSLTGLLNTAEDLDAAIADLIDRGENPYDKVITEYCNVADADGVFRKYSAFVVGDRVLPLHVAGHKHWVVKTRRLETDAIAEDHAALLRDNPHADQIRQVFALARIDYGRIDYGFLGDRLQVWEINTNPSIVLPANQRATDATMDQFRRSLAEAFTAIAPPRRDRPAPMTLTWPRPDQDLGKGFIERTSDWFPWLPTPQKAQLRRILRRIKQRLR
ncbi:MAG: hypothetical protein Fur0042_19070 [Cyanophyceae cyanobacterium]